MKTIGLIGGMSWESTVTYYQIINRTVSEQLGGLHSAKILLFSIDFDELAILQENNQWDQAYQMMGDAAKRLEMAKADFIVIGANTMHKAVDEVRKHIHIPVLHIAEATASVLHESGIRRVGLTGTKYTVLEDFYKDILIREGIDVLISSEKDVEEINTIIYEELCAGIISAGSKQKYLKICEDLYDKGAEGIILGCTELDLLLSQNDTQIPLFDTTFIHAQKAALLSIEEELKQMSLK